MAGKGHQLSHMALLAGLTDLVVLPDSLCSNRISSMRGVADLRLITLVVGCTWSGLASAQAVGFTDDFNCSDVSTLGDVPGEFGWMANWAGDPWQTDLNDGVSPTVDSSVGDFGGAADAYENFLLTGHYLWMDMAIQATVNSVDDGAVGLVGHYNGGSESYYACWTTHGDFPGCFGLLSDQPGSALVRVDNSGCSNDFVLAQNNLPLYPLGVDFGVRMEVVGGVVTCSFDYDLDGIFGTGGDVVLQYNDQTPLPSGYAGLAAFASGEGSGQTIFDNVITETWDPDADGDGVSDLVEQTIGGANGDADMDDDGISDAVEYGMQAFPYSTDIDGLEDFRDPDSDGDSIWDFIEAGGVPPVDTNCDGVPDYRDTDSDGDGWPDIDDLCRVNFSTQDDFDGDGLGDECDGDPYWYDQDFDGLTDGQEVNEFGTDPNNADTDGGGVEDYDEIFVDFTDPLDPSDDNAADTDGDGLNDFEETNVYFTDPYLADTDGDGVNDGDEVDDLTDPLVMDTDGDGLDDGQEKAQATDPLIMDSDGDGLDDGPEISAGSNPLLADTDGDTLDDGPEVNTYGTDPTSADTDADLLRDDCELLSCVQLSDPLNPDDDGDTAPTADEDLDDNGDPQNDDLDLDGLPNYLDDDDDGDGILTADEDWNSNGDLDDDDLDLDGIPSWLDDNEVDVERDSDEDGIPDYIEEIIGSDSLRTDSDSDGVPDADEIGDPTDPTDSDGDGTPDIIDVDDDGDGLLTENELGDADNPTDTDGDSIPDYLDPDSDNDGAFDGGDPDPLSAGGDAAKVPPEADHGFGLGCSTTGTTPGPWLVLALLLALGRRSSSRARY